MARQAFFKGLVYDEDDRPLETAVVGQEATYIIDDAGFQRHIDAEQIDRQVIGFFLQQLDQNKDLAVEQAMTMMGKDDFMTKAAIDASLRNIDMDQILAAGIPEQARNMMGMMGLRITVNFHGDVLRIDQPSMPDEE